MSQLKIGWNQNGIARLQQTQLWRIALPCCLLYAFISWCTEMLLAGCCEYEPPTDDRSFSLQRPSCIPGRMIHPAEKHITDKNVRKVYITEFGTIMVIMQGLIYCVRRDAQISMLTRVLVVLPVWACYLLPDCSARWIRSCVTPESARFSGYWRRDKQFLYIAHMLNFDPSLPQSQSILQELQQEAGEKSVKADIESVYQRMLSSSDETCWRKLSHTRYNLLRDLNQFDTLSQKDQATWADDAYAFMIRCSLVTYLQTRPLLSREMDYLLIGKDEEEVRSLVTKASQDLWQHYNKYLETIGVKDMSACLDYPRFQSVMRTLNG